MGIFSVLLASVACTVTCLLYVKSRASSRILEERFGFLSEEQDRVKLLNKELLGALLKEAQEFSRQSQEAERAVLLLVQRIEEASRKNNPKVN